MRVMLSLNSSYGCSSWEYRKFFLCRGLCDRTPEPSSARPRASASGFASSEIVAGPREAFVGTARRLVLAADPAGVADAVEMLEQEGIVDLAGAGLVPAGIVGKLQMRDAREVFLDGARKIAFHDLHVIDVVLKEEVVGADFLDDFQSL